MSNQSESYEETVALAEELERIERRYNSASELSSDCAYEEPPTVSCDEGVCVGTAAQ